METPTGTIALKKTSEDGVVAGISFTIKGENFNKTVTTDENGNLTVEGLFPGTYTITEQSIDMTRPLRPIKMVRSSLKVCELANTRYLRSATVFLLDISCLPISR